MGAAMMGRPPRVPVDLLAATKEVRLREFAADLNIPQEAAALGPA
jgi:hypothetical protein